MDNITYVDVKMTVTWKRSFRAALMIVLYSIGWVIVAMILIGVGSITTIASSISSFGGIGTSAATAISIALFIAAYIVAGIGVFAAQLKVSTELIADVENRLKDRT
ncbi:MAG: hypothetical protein KatS3mg003_0724 [Candidatus Nitrosocaldaceae archaeon]|nr:MAG: hypothetical protein KatS3mg003_0724 [Candidatus Nitrosocaldaceae archaeon]